MMKSSHFRALKNMFNGNGVIGSMFDFGPRDAGLTKNTPTKICTIYDPYVPITDSSLPEDARGAVFLERIQKEFELDTLSEQHP